MQDFLERTTIKQSLLQKRVQLKTFVHQNIDEAEKAINNWLELNDITIQHIGQSQSEKNGRFVFVISLFYQRA
jgi:hypothetical protein